MSREHGGRATRGQGQISHRTQSAWRPDAEAARPGYCPPVRGAGTQARPGPRAAAAGAQASEPHIHELGASGRKSSPLHILESRV